MQKLRYPTPEIRGPLSGKPIRISYATRELAKGPQKNLLEKAVERTTIHIDLAQCIRSFFWGVALVIAALNAPQALEWISRIF